MNDWAPVITCLDQVADILVRYPGLDPDGAVRFVIWDSVDTPHPGDNEPGAALFDIVESLIEGYIAAQDGHECGDGIAWIPGDRAIAACEAEAERLRNIDGGQ